MPEADGYVRIDTRMDDTKLLRQLSSLGEKLNKQLSGLERAKQNVESLERAFEKLTSGKETPKSVINLEKEIERAEKDVDKINKQLDALTSERRELIAGNIGGINNAAIGDLNERIDELSTKFIAAVENVERLKEKLAELKADPTKTEEAAEIAKKLELARSEVERLSADADNTRASMESLRNTTAGVEKEAVKSASAFERMRNYIGRLAKRMLVLYAFRRVFTYIRNTIMSLSGLSVVTGVFTDFNNKMREAFQNNTQIQGALARLRGALYTAFQPIYETVVPALVSLINWLSKGIQYITAFFSALSGKTLQDNAKGAKDLANSVDAVGGAAKGANEQLAQFDKLNTLTENKGGGGGGGGSPNADFSDIGKGIDLGWVKTLIDNIKGRLEPAINRVKAASERFKEAWEKLKQNFDGSWLKNIIEDLLTLGGTVVLDGLTVLIDALTVLVELFNALQTGDWSGFENALGHLFTDIATLLEDLKRNILLIIIDALMPIAQAFDQAFGTDTAKRLEQTRTNILNLEEPFQETTENAEELKKKVIEDGIVVKETTAEITISAQEAAGGVSSIGGSFTDVEYILKHLHIPTFHIDGWSEKELNLGPFGSFTISLPDIKFYKGGGFPTAGSMFIAGEAGPELVGSFGGNNNAVINEAQLVQAFRQASSEQVALLQQQNSLLAAILNKSGEVTFKPSSAAGKVFSQSINMYNRAMG